MDFDLAFVKMLMLKEPCRTYKHFFICRVCDKIFITGWLLQIHFHLKLIISKKCTFSERLVLNISKQTSHKKLRLFCHFYYFTMRSLSEHIQNQLIDKDTFLSKSTLYIFVALQNDVGYHDYCKCVPLVFALYWTFGN